LDTSITPMLMACEERSPQRDLEEGSVRLAETYGHRREKEMLKLYLWIRNLFADEEGQTLTEYALILVLIVIAALVIMGTMGGQINNIFNKVSNTLTFP